jgi:hypothetical protein
MTDNWKTDLEFKMMRHLIAQQRNKCGKEIKHFNNATGTQQIDDSSQ